jgi:hypothetical protein
MTRLFKRNASATITYQDVNAAPSGAPTISTVQADVTALRMRFKIEKSLTKDPNTCDLTISNLNENSRGAFTRKPVTITLNAGYDGELRHLFTGDLRFGSSELKTPDWETKLQLGTGDRAFRYSRINKSYGRFVALTQVLKDCAASMGLTVPQSVLYDAFVTGVQFNLGETLSGPTRDQLSRLLAPYGYHWSIQDTKLVVLRDEEVSEDVSTVISQDTGLIETPQLSAPNRPGTKKGDAPVLKAKLLLYPGMVPGQRIQLSAKAVNGTFKLTKVSHVGDTHGPDWFTEIEGKAV